MGTFKCFEEIEAWQKARELTKEVYLVTKSLPFSKDYGLKDQICRASVSVMSNIAEGFERGGTMEFIQFLSIAKGSVGEVKSQLYIALDQNYIQQTEFEKLMNKAFESGKMIGGLIQYLKTTSIKGVKFRDKKLIQKQTDTENQKPVTRN